MATRFTSETTTTADTTAFEYVRQDSTATYKAAVLVAYIDENPPPEAECKEYKEPIEEPAYSRIPRNDEPRAVWRRRPQQMPSTYG